MRGLPYKTIFMIKLATDNTPVILDDDCDLSWASGRIYINQRGYAMMYSKETQNMKVLHRVIARADKGEMVDHINGNRVDNRAVNLRKCTARENCMNRLVKGFHRNDKNRKSVRYRARVRIDGKSVHLGNFKTPEEARSAYMKFYTDRGERFIPRLTKNPLGV